jgi:hypothetical protein
VAKARAAAAAAKAKKKEEGEQPSSAASTYRNTAPTRKASISADYPVSAGRKRKSPEAPEYKLTSNNAPKKRQQKKCSAEGCTNQVVKGGVCKRDGAKVVPKLCSSEGCTNLSVKGGVCVRHGAKRNI